MYSRIASSNVRLAIRSFTRSPLYTPKALFHFRAMADDQYTTPKRTDPSNVPNPLGEGNYIK